MNPEQTMASVSGSQGLLPLVGSQRDIVIVSSREKKRDQRRCHGGPWQLRAFVCCGGSPILLTDTAPIEVMVLASDGAVDSDEVT